MRVSVQLYYPFDKALQSYDELRVFSESGMLIMVIKKPTRKMLRSFELPPLKQWEYCTWGYQIETDLSLKGK